MIFVKFQKIQICKVTFRLKILSLGIYRVGFGFCLINAISCEHLLPRLQTATDRFRHRNKTGEAICSLGHGGELFHLFCVRNAIRGGHDRHFASPSFSLRLFLYSCWMGRTKFDKKLGELNNYLTNCLDTNSLDCRLELIRTMYYWIVKLLFCEINFQIWNLSNAIRDVCFLKCLKMKEESFKN